MAKLRLQMSRVFLVAFLVAAVSSHSLKTEEGSQFKVDSGILAGIDDALEAFVEKKEISGAVTLVALEGRVVHHGAVGLADIEAGQPMRTDSIFAIASMTKPITATAVMILQDEGKLAVRDPVSKYLPEFAGARIGGVSAKRAMTIRDLLTHTSGVGSGPRGPAADGLSLEEIVDHIAKAPLQFEPGSTWRYGSGLTVCGRIVEVVSGQPFETFLEQRLFGPLGMKDTTFYPSQSQRKRLAKIYKPTADRSAIEPTRVAWADPDRKRAPNPSGGLYSTSSDMLRFYQAILNGGELDGTRIVSREAVRAMRSVQTGDLTTGFTPGNGWGLGWCVVREPQGVTGMLSPGTFGHGGAFGTQGWVDPARRMILVLMIQRTGFGNSDASAIRKTFQEIATSSLRNKGRGGQ